LACILDPPTGGEQNAAAKPLPPTNFALQLPIMNPTFHNLLLLPRSALGRIAQSVKGGLLIPDVRCQSFVRQNWWGVLDVVSPPKFLADSSKEYV
jgi:hypothetical protein